MQKNICIFGGMLLLSLSACVQQVTKPQAQVTQPISPIAQQCKQVGVNYSEAIRTVAILQKALKKQDKETISSLINYPLRVNKEGAENIPVTLRIQNKLSFLYQYNGIMNAKMQTLIIAAKPSDIFCNDQGAMIAHGAVWFTPVKDHLKISTINIME